MEDYVTIFLPDKKSISGKAVISPTEIVVFKQSLVPVLGKIILMMLIVFAISFCAGLLLGLADLFNQTTTTIISPMIGVSVYYIIQSIGRSKNKNPIISGTSG